MHMRTQNMVHGRVLQIFLYEFGVNTHPQFGMNVVYRGGGGRAYSGFHGTTSIVAACMAEEVVVRLTRSAAGMLSS